MSEFKIMQQTHQWVTVSLGCAVAMVLALVLGLLGDALAMVAARGSEAEAGLIGAGFVMAAILCLLLLSPIGVLAGAIGLACVPHRRMKAVLAILACATPWLLSPLASRIRLSDLESPGCACAEMDAEQ